MHSHCRQTRRSAPRGSRGFTMIELMITVALVAIVLSLAYPSFVSVINSNRLAGASNDLIGDLQYARSEAIRRNSRVSVCASADGSTCGGGNWANWIVRVGNPAEVLRTGSAKQPVQLLASAAVGASGVTFRSDGMARTAAGLLLDASFAACIPTTNPKENARVIRLGFGSRVMTTKENGGGACAAPADK
jgi:type IV fimbrial biogenesis protein FimT